MTRRRTIAWAAVAAVALLIAIGVLVVMAPLGMFGDRAEEEFRFHNQTDRDLIVFQIWGDGSEHRLERVRPGEGSLWSSLCGAGELVARDARGDEIATRVREECDLEDWYITLPGG